MRRLETDIGNKKKTTKPTRKWGYAWIHNILEVQVDRVVEPVVTETVTPGGTSYAVRVYG